MNKENFSRLVIGLILLGLTIFWNGVGLFVFSFSGKTELYILTLIAGIVLAIYSLRLVLTALFSREKITPGLRL